MTSHLPDQVQLRPYTRQDIPPLVTIFNAIYPDEPVTVEQQEHWESTYPAGNPRVQQIAETAAGQIVGYGECQFPFWSSLSGVYNCFVAVDPAWQRRGIGQALLAAVEPFAVDQGAGRLRTDCREDAAGAVRFLERAGFTQIGIRFESALDIAAFDAAPFLPYLEQTTDAGYEITTLADMRQSDPEADLHLYEVFAATIVDVPFPGEDRARPDYQNFLSSLSSPTSDPRAIFIARHNGRMVGMTSLELLPNAVAITGMTGVLAAHRGQGVAMALKVASFRYLQEHGYTEARTHNDTANPPILALNKRLGYSPLPGWLAWEKVLGGS